MPRACVLVNNAIVATILSEQTTRDVCAVTIDVTPVRKYVYCSVYLPHDEPSPTDAFYRLWVLGFMEENPVNRSSTHTSLLPLMVNLDKIVLAPSDIIHVSSFPYRTGEQVQASVHVS